MKRTTKKVLAATIAALAAFICQPSAQAQTADSLIDKLVEKGVLTVKEGQTLRDEADKDFTRAYSAKSGMPEWVTAFKINGDIRLRYEGFFREGAPAGVASPDQNRFRYRLRFGGTAVMTDNMEVGFGLVSQAAGGDPISGNQSLQDNASKKAIAIDLAYAKWSPINTPDWSLAFTGGKIKNPFVFSDMVFDSDYTPEGGALEAGYNLNAEHAFKFITGGFVLDENAATSRDPYLVAAQLRFDSTWSERLKTSFGVAALSILGGDMLTTALIANNINAGNTRNTNGVVTEGFNPIVVDGSVTYNFHDVPNYAGPFPVTLAGEYMNNPRAANLGEAYSVGITFGKAGKKGLWEVGYRWKELQNDAWYEELTDSDTGAFYQTAPVNSGLTPGYRSGTGVRGHVIRSSYSPYDSLTFSVSLFNIWAISENPVNTGSTINRLQVDASWKF